MIVYIRNVTIFYFQFLCFMLFAVLPLPLPLLLLLLLLRLPLQLELELPSPLRACSLCSFGWDFFLFLFIFGSEPSLISIAYKTNSNGFSTYVTCSADCNKHIIFDNCIHDYRRTLKCMKFLAVWEWNKNKMFTFSECNVAVLRALRSHFEKKLFLSLSFFSRVDFMVSLFLIVIYLSGWCVNINRTRSRRGINIQGTNMNKPKRIEMRARGKWANEKKRKKNLTK